MTAFAALVARDLRLALRQGADAAMAVLFFVIGVALFPFAVGPEANILARIAPGVIWVMALLATLLALERLFLADYEDGSLEVLATGPLPLELVAAAKSLAHWISTGIPLALMAPVLGIMLNLEARAYPLVIATMLAGTPAISFLGAIGVQLLRG